MPDDVQAVDDDFDRLLTAQQVGDRLGITPQHVRRLCKAGNLAFHWISRRAIRIPESEVRRYLTATRIDHGRDPKAQRRRVAQAIRIERTMRALG